MEENEPEVLRCSWNWLRSTEGLPVKEKKSEGGGKMARTTHQSKIMQNDDAKVSKKVAKGP